jgi:hypothetical protein
MKTKKLLIMMGVLGCTFTAQSQQNEVSLFKVQDFSVLPTMQVFNATPATLNDFNELAEGSMLLARDYSGFNRSDFGATNGAGGFEVMLGMGLRNKDKSGYRQSAQLRVGVGYSSVSSLSANYHQDERKPYDTLVSSQTGNSVFVDSVTHRNLSLNYNTDNVRLDVSMIFRTTGVSRWSLYGGVGVRANYSFNGYTSVNYYEQKGTEQERQDFNGYYGYGLDFEDSQSENEVFRSNESSFGGAVYVPLGVDVRFGKTSDFWTKIHLFGEVRPGLDFSNIPTYGSVTQGFLQFGLGLRVTG